MQNSHLAIPVPKAKNLPFQILFGQFFLPFAHAKNYKVSLIIKGLPPLDLEHQFG